MRTDIFRFYGGHPVLDFANTVAWRLGTEPIEKLRAYDDLVRWSSAAAMIDTRTATALRREARRSPRAAARALGKAVRLRELIYRLCDALQHDRRPKRGDLEELNRSIQSAQRGATLRWRGNALRWDVSEPGLDCLLPPLVRAAADLLTSDQARRIGQCQDADGCGWLFLDNSRSRERQWCSMDGCGNRAKARRYYRRAN